MEFTSRPPSQNLGFAIPQTPRIDAYDHFDDDHFDIERNK